MVGSCAHDNFICRVILFQLRVEGGEDLYRRPTPELTMLKK